MSIGSKIKALRKEAKLTQHQLSSSANISRAYLADLERDRYNPSIKTLSNISNSLNVPIFEFLHFPGYYVSPGGNDPELEYYMEIRIEKFLALDKHGQNIVDAILDMEHKRCMDSNKKA